MTPALSLLNTIEGALDSKIRSKCGDLPPLEDAMSYAVLKGGKRIRPLLTLLVAEHLPHPEAAIPAALATEYFHAASLVADDLPSMDNAALRREKPTVHTLYGEANAILVTYALISDGYQLIGESSSLCPSSERGERLQMALSLASKSTGLKGATGGQYLDLNKAPKSLDEALDLLKRKTASFFAMAFGLGWIFGGGALDKLPLVEEAAYHFGLGFQLADDLLDEEMDREEGKGGNLCVYLGRDQVKVLLTETSKKFGEAIHRLGLSTSPFEMLVKNLLSSTEDEKIFAKI